MQDYSLRNTKLQIIFRLDLEGSHLAYVGSENARKRAELHSRACALQTAAENIIIYFLVKLLCHAVLSFNVSKNAKNSEKRS